MCTVTFIPGKDRYFITSNRDEKGVRKKAVPPQVYVEKNNMLAYPKDAAAGGTWISMKDNGNAAVLLNGAFTKHLPLPPYSRSRGLVFLDILSSGMAIKCFKSIELTRVEPFTMIIFEQENLYECRWDGDVKHCSPLANNRPFIWSSVTLYTKDIIQKRKCWFASWLAKNPQPCQADILHFHQFAGDGDQSNDLLMNRDNQMLTVSVTGMELTPGKGVMLYKDLATKKQYRCELEFSTAMEAI